MNIRPTQLTGIIIILILLFSGNTLFAHVEKAKKLEELERILKIDVNYKQDTNALKKRLDSVKVLADERRSIPIKWAYYMLMADGFSISFDAVNERSNYYYKLAQELVEPTKEYELQQMGLIRQGYYYFIYRDIKNAFPYFLRANDLKDEVKMERIPRLPLHYAFIAGFYSYIGNQQIAKQYLKLALPYTEPLSRTRIDMINSLAVYSMKDSLSSEAMDYLKQALHTAELAKDSVWIGIISGNMADVEWEKGNRSKAIALVQKNIYYSNKFNEPLDAMRANLIIASMYVKEQDWNNAKKHVLEAEKIMDDKPYFLLYKTDAMKVRADIAKGTNDPIAELRYLNEYLLLKDSLEKNLNIEKLQKVSFQWESEKYEQSLINSELKRKQVNQTYLFIVAFFVLGFVIILLLVNRSKNKILFKNAALEKEQMEMAYEKQLVDRELLLLNNSLQEFTNTIKQNDLTIQRLRNEVITNLDHFPDQQEKFNDSLSKMLENQVMNEERWLKFKNIFDRVYPGYLSREKENYPKLTDYDLRLLALMKLGLNNRSMGDLLGITLEGVKKAKQRLKKKLDVN